MTCPIGVAGIDGKRPAAIAIAVAAELLQQYESHQRRASAPAPATQAKSHDRRSAAR
jgi:xanthine dehydrogenase accessory factor